MDYKRRFLLGGSKHKVQQNQQQQQQQTQQNQSQQQQQYQSQLSDLGRTLAGSGTGPLASSCVSTVTTNSSSSSSSSQQMPSASSPCQPGGGGGGGGGPGGGGGSGGSGGPGPSAAVADIQQGISKYLDALNVFCRASALLTELFSGVFRNSPYGKAACQLREVQEGVMDAAARLTAAIKPEIAKMLMELNAGAAAHLKHQQDFSMQDVEVLGRCFLTVMQVHFQFLSQALQKVQPAAQSCLQGALSQAQERHTHSHSQTHSHTHTRAQASAHTHTHAQSSVSPAAGPAHAHAHTHTPLSEIDDAARSWKAASEATCRLRERGRDGCLSGLQVQQLFCSHSSSLPEHTLTDLNANIDHALQAYKVALEGLGHSEYALRGGFHLSPKSAEAALQGCCSDAEAQQAGRMQTMSQPITCELPTIPVLIGSHFLKGVSFNESAAENLKLKMHTVLQLIKEAVGVNGVSVCEESPVTDVLNQVCPSSWRAACKTAVQLLFGQAGLVVVDTAQVESREAYAPQITLEGTKVVVQVPSTWCLKEDPATMSLLQRSLDPEKTLGLVDVLYTHIYDLKERKEQALPIIQIQLQRDAVAPDYGSHGDQHHPSSISTTGGGGGPKSSSGGGGLPKTISKLTSKFTRKASSIPNTPSRSNHDDNKPPKGPLPLPLPLPDSRLIGLLQLGGVASCVTDSAPGALLANGVLPNDEQSMNLPTDQEMQDVIDFLSGFNMAKSQTASPLLKRRNSVPSSSSSSSVATTTAASPPDIKPPPQTAVAAATTQHALQQQPLQQQPTSAPQHQLSVPKTTPPAPPHSPQTHPPQLPPSQQQALQYYQHLLQPITSQQQQQANQQQANQQAANQQQPQQPSPQHPSQSAQRVSGKWPMGASSSPQPHPHAPQAQGPPPTAAQGPPGGLSSPLGPLGQWGAPGSGGLGCGELSLSSDLYSLGLVSSYMDSMMADMLGNKAGGVPQGGPQGPRNNTWPNRDQSDSTGAYGVLGDTLPFDPAVGSDPEFARYVAGVNQAMQAKRQATHIRRPGNARSNWPLPDDTHTHRTWPHPEYYSEGEAVTSSWSTNQGDSASSSDEASSANGDSLFSSSANGDSLFSSSSANGDSLFSMFSGPDLVAAVKQRRKHSCGDPEVCTLPSPPLHHTSADDSCQDSKVKTWPPKAPWQHSSSSSSSSSGHHGNTNTMPNLGATAHHHHHHHHPVGGGPHGTHHSHGPPHGHGSGPPPPISSLYPLNLNMLNLPPPSLSSQWSDSLQLLQSAVWSSSANDCSSSAGGVGLAPGSFPFPPPQQPGGSGSGGPPQSSNAPPGAPPGTQQPPQGTPKQPPLGSTKGFKTFPHTHKPDAHTHSPHTYTHTEDTHTHTHTHKPDAHTHRPSYLHPY